MKKIVVAAVILLASGTGYVGYDAYSQDRFVRSLVPLVKNTSLRVSNSARYESDGDSTITYKELFERIESDVQEVDRNLLAIQTLSAPGTASITEPTVDYVRAGQACLRSLLAKYRKQLELSSAVSSADRAIKEISGSSPYARELAERRSDEAIQRVGDAENEYKASLPEVVHAVTQLLELRERVGSIFPEDALIPVAQLETVAQKNAKKSESAASPSN